MKEVIERIVAHLTDFNKDPIFLNIKKELLSIIDNNEIPSENIKIFLGPSFSKDAYLREFNSVKIVTHSTFKGFEVTISFDSLEYSYNFEVSGCNVDFSGYYYDEESKMHFESYSYQINEEGKKLIYRKDIIDRNDYFEDYNVEISYFDHQGNPLNINTEVEKDILFSEEFGISLLESSFYRTHFSQYREYINESRIHSGMQYEDQDEDNTNLFSSPFNLEDIKDIFMFDLNDSERLGRAFDFNYTLEDLEEAEYRLMTIKNMLASQIGITGEIVLSNNIFLNIAKFIFNSSSTYLKTSGTIIKKENGEFICFCVNIESNGIMSMRKPLTKEEVLTIYNSNAKNKNVPGLEEFFEIERNRR